ncbi:MAG: FKBP-type peptidyl-prolyl cis-trans isomerase [Bacteroidales bacterium]|nr:FKBP-type peptidyl-prolyl cis-trans isomerase [Bacteroidales bacterium]
MEYNMIKVAYRLYVMKGTKKEVVEEATKDDPFAFITGLNGTLERFENELFDKPEGSSFQFTIPVSEAYGEYVSEGVRTVEKSMFEVDGVFDKKNIFEGAIVPLQDGEGHQFYATIKKVGLESVTVDLNHPLAGKDLTFMGEVIENRPATEKEIANMMNQLENEGCHCDCCGGGCGGDCGCEGEHHHHDGCGCGHCH